MRELKIVAAGVAVVSCLTGCSVQERQWSTCAVAGALIGGDAYNKKLSERRAEAVKRYLVRQGIDAGRIRTVGYGKTKPVADNGTEEGRAKNRRAEVVVE